MKPKYDLDQLVMMQDALDAMDDTSCIDRTEFVECNKPAVRHLYSQAWDDAKALVLSSGSLKKAANTVSGLIEVYRKEAQ